MRIGSCVRMCALAALVLCACQKVAKEEQFAKIGSTMFSRASFDAFMKMQRLYPSALRSVFPGERSPATFMVETEVLYRKARWGRGAMKRSGDWQWKKRYFPAQLYIQDIIGENAGFTERELEAYYNQIIDTFKVVKQVPVMRDSAAGDSVIKVATDSTKDSTFLRPLAEVRERIKEELFCRTYPPDSAFFADMASQLGSGDEEQGASDSVQGPQPIDSALVLTRWYQRWRRDLPTFFMKKQYASQFGGPMPDSLVEWYGEGKAVTPGDMDVILNWLSEDRRESYKNPAGTKYLAEWLLKWKLFEAQAKKTGFDKGPEIASVLEWAWKLQVVSQYIENKLLPKARQGVAVDTTMCVFAYWDRRGKPGVMPDSADLATTLQERHDKIVGVNLDKIISSMRARTGVAFLQSDWKDEKDGDPKAMMAEADSLLAANDSRKAESKYRDVSKYFPYTEEGMKALTEMAKIQTEKGKYRDAINNYRDYILMGGDAERRCNTFFMIGFIYDEYLNKSENAEVHYKWILKNTPDCELADDAEFMCLHLDEPMTSVEELQAEARRQGRKIDDTEPVEVIDTVDIAEGGE